ncbi:MAG TPA: helicase-related protein, partial [Lachnospiraceae bacterium]|nr:helicase-related protein [Lachnospiraceae bacterium]
VIFSVDMFNEGLDLPSVDMVLFLRPTESPIVFLQQLGRGLRKSKGKDYLNVLDFIGNYDKAGRAPYLLSGKNQIAEKRKSAGGQDFEFPDDCIVDFDMRLIDLFKEMDKRGLTIHDRIKTEFFRVKELLDGKVPSRMELFTYMDDAIYQLCMSNTKDNPFRRYLEYLHDIEELSQSEIDIYQGLGREFLSIVETTDMQKVYKMPILLSFYNEGKVRVAVTDDEVLFCWKGFFATGTNWKDLGKEITYEEFKNISDRKHLSNIMRNPINFLKASGKGFFVDKEGYALALREELKDIVVQEAFRAHFKDIIEYRTMEYYRRRYESRE